MVGGAVKVKDFQRKGKRKGQREEEKKEWREGETGTEEE